MDDEEKLTPHEAVVILHDQLKALMRRTGCTPEEAVKRFNEAARRAGVNVRVSLEDAKDSSN